MFGLSTFSIIKKTSFKLRNQIGIFKNVFVEDEYINAFVKRQIRPFVSLSERLNKTTSQYFLSRWQNIAGCVIFPRNKPYQTRASFLQYIWGRKQPYLWISYRLESFDPQILVIICLAKKFHWGTCSNLQVQRRYRHLLTTFSENWKTLSFIDLKWKFTELNGLSVALRYESLE